MLKIHCKGIGIYFIIISSYYVDLVILFYPFAQLPSFYI